MSTEQRKADAQLPWMKVRWVYIHGTCWALEVAEVEEQPIAKADRYAVVCDMKAGRWSSARVEVEKGVPKLHEVQHFAGQQEAWLDAIARSLGMVSGRVIRTGRQLKLFPEEELGVPTLPPAVAKFLGFGGEGPQAPAPASVTFTPEQLSQVRKAAKQMGKGGAVSVTVGDRTVELGPEGASDEDAAKLAGMVREVVGR